MIFVGVDGGGTKTAFSAIDENGNNLYLYETTTCHYEQVGLDGFKNIIEKGILKIKENLKIENNSIDFVFLGVPGYGEREEYDVKIHTILNGVLKGIKFKCGNDVENGWAGSLACSPGINLVAGTGAIAYGLNEKNESARSSGWGFFCGDEGSAFWIGKKGIELFCKQADGRMEKNKLYNIYKDELKLDKDFDLINYVYNTINFERGKVAEMATLVFKGALAGDLACIEIFQEAAYEHYLMVKGVVEQLKFKDEVKISYSGGVFKSRDLVLGPLKKYLEENNIKGRLIEPQLSPVLGAALYAYKLSGKDLNENIVRNLRGE